MRHDLVERKAQGEEIAIQPDAPQPTKVPDLMAALEASLAAVKDKPSGDGDKAKGSGAKKAPAKKAPTKKTPAKKAPAKKKTAAKS